MTTCQLRPPVCASSAAKRKRRGLVIICYEEMHNNAEFKRWAQQFPIGIGCIEGQCQVGVKESPKPELAS
eukprot:7171416-Lingulodinium_polyedra.AAC.1